MDSDLIGILYLTVVRLSVIAAGIISIVCGYRLFLAGVFHVYPKAPPTQITSRLSGAEFTLKSVAPGTCFAFFGAALIVITMYTSSPNFERARTISLGSEDNTTAGEVLRMRGKIIGFTEIVEQAKKEEKEGNRNKAIETYARALRLIAEPLNNLAWLYHEEGRDKEAIPLAQLSVQFAAK